MLKARQELKPLRVAALFAGIGGFEKGLHEAGGYRTVLFAENDVAASEVLKARFPGVENFGDVRELKSLDVTPDVVTAGFPCQDLSQAGRTKGIRGERSGLIQHVFGLLKKHRVEWLLIENVPFMLQLDRGAGIRYLVSELEELEYQWAYRVVDARAFGLPQRRRRVFLLASLNHDPAQVLFREDAGPPEEEEADVFGFYWTEGNRGVGWARGAVPTLKGGSGLGIPSPPAVWIPGEGIYTPGIEAGERLQGFPAGWTNPAVRVDRPSARWRLVGNAISVPVATWVGRVLGADPAEIPTPVAELPDDGSWPWAGFGSEHDGRHEVGVSDWPIKIPMASLMEFIEDDRKSLSERATAGFLARFLDSPLREPEAGFVEGLREHLAVQRA